MFEAEQNYKQANQVFNKVYSDYYAITLIEYNNPDNPNYYYLNHIELMDVLKIEMVQYTTLTI